MSNKFRPQAISKYYAIKIRLKIGRSDGYNFQPRIEWYRAGWGINKRVLGRQFSRLHYLACHAPKPVAKQWQAAYNNFENKYFARKGKASVRYLNKYTAHSWL
jgi:hypothetical protein